MRAPASLVLLLVAALVLSAQPEVSARDVTGVNCVPGTSFTHGCDVCRCRADGHSGACTNRHCTSGDT